MKGFVEWMTVVDQGSNWKQGTCKVPGSFPSLNWLYKGNASNKIQRKIKIKSEKCIV